MELENIVANTVYLKAREGEHVLLFVFLVTWLTLTNYRATAGHI